MKKIFLVLFALCLTGCFENSGYLIKSCKKIENVNTLTTITVYTFGFKNDVIDDMDILYSFEDKDEITINSIKTSYETQNKYLNINYEVLNDSLNNYEVKYDIDMNSDEEILNKFMVVKSRTQLVKDLEKQGFRCE